MPENELISVPHLHSTTFGIGGSQRFTKNVAETIYRDGNLGKLITGDDHPPYLVNGFDTIIPREQVVYFQRPSTKTPVMLNNPQNRQVLLDAMERGLTPVRGDRREISRVYAQYYAAGAIACEIGRQRNGLRVAMTPHTLERCVNTVGVGDTWDEVISDGRSSLRTEYEGRDAEEVTCLRECDLIILGTQAETELVTKLYGTDVPDIQDRLRFAHLAVGDNFHRLGRLSPEQRKTSRSAGVAMIIEGLRTTAIQAQHNSRPEDAEWYFRQFTKANNNIYADTFLYYWVGRFEDGKGLEYAAKAFIDMMVQNGGRMNAAMLFTGGPIDLNKPQLRKIQDYINNIPENIRPYIANKLIFTGPIPGEMTAQAAHCGVFNSDQESFSLVSLESLAAGNITIATRIPTVREVTNGHATLVDPRNTDEIATAMQTAFYSDLNQALYDNPRYAQHFTWERTTNRILQLMDQV